MAEEERDKPMDGPDKKAPAPHHGGPLGSSGAAPAADADKTPEMPTATDRPTLPPSAPTPPSATTPRPTTAEPSTTETPPSKTSPGTTSSSRTPPSKTPPGTTQPPETASAAASEPAQIDLDKPATVSGGGGGGGARMTRVLRRANPMQAARSTREWARRPIGRFLIPTALAVLLIGGAGTAGAYLVPRALDSAAAPVPSSGFPFEGAAPEVSAPSGGTLPLAPDVVGSAPPGFGVPAQRPADALNEWARGVGTRVGIPVVAVQAYGYAELVAARSSPTCRLSWTTIAAIAKVESAHGSANGAVLGADGSVQPPILGLPLDGKGGRQEIRDTDQGTIDGDTTYDRAVGPLQFIPATWREMAVDADNNGVADPNDIDDASLAAAMYLCRGGRDLSKADSWWEAILSYNAVQPYAQDVFDAANEYGQRSRV